MTKIDHETMLHDIPPLTREPLPTDAKDAEVKQLRAEIERLRTMLALEGVAAFQINEELRAEVERLTLENWQLKGALGYPVPGDIPHGPFKCGLCEARALQAGQEA